MHRPTKGRRSVARVIGTAFAIVLYVTVLVAATQVSGAGAGATAAQPDALAAMGVAAQPAPAAQAAGLDDVAESPLLTLAIAGVALAGAAGYRLTRLARRPRPAPIPVRGRRVSMTT